MNLLTYLYLYIYSVESRPSWLKIKAILKACRSNKNIKVVLPMKKLNNQEELEAELLANEDSSSMRKDLIEIDSYESDTDEVFDCNESDYIGYNEQYKEMKIRIDRNIQNKRNSLSSVYEEFKTYRDYHLKQAIKDSVSNLCLLSCSNLLKTPKLENQLNLKKQKKILLVLDVLTNITKEVFKNLPEVIGLSLKLIEQVDCLNDSDFLRVLLQLDFCINIMKTEPDEEIFREIVEKMKRSKENQVEYKKHIIFKNIENIFLTLSGREALDVYDVYLEEQIENYHNTIRHLKSIIYILEPNDVSLILSLIKNQQSGKETEDDLEHLNQSMRQVCKLIYEIAPMVFGCKLEISEDKVSEIQNVNPRNIQSQLEVIFYGILEGMDLIK